MNDCIYDIYKQCKKFLKTAKKYEDRNSDEEALFQDWKNAVQHIENSMNGYQERYEREEAVIDSFTPMQIDHICYQIGNWYLMMKPLLEGQHNLGHMKEKLKMMICGE